MKVRKRVRRLVLLGPSDFFGYGPFLLLILPVLAHLLSFLNFVTKLYMEKVLSMLENISKNLLSYKSSCGLWMLNFMGY
jgi:hypothetical protein